MTDSQKLSLRLSEIRQRLNEIGGLTGADFTDEIRSESETLQTEFRDTEIRWRSAEIAESTIEPQAAGSEIAQWFEVCICVYDLNPYHQSCPNSWCLYCVLLFQIPPRAAFIFSFEKKRCPRCSLLMC